MNLRIAITSSPTSKRPRTRFLWGFVDGRGAGEETGYWQLMMIAILEADDFAAPMMILKRVAFPACTLHGIVGG